MIIAITGRLQDTHGNCRIAGAGKDEVAKVLAQHGFVSVAFSDVMKRWCRDLFSFTDDQLWGKSETRAEPDQRFPRVVPSFDVGDAFEASRLGIPDPGKVEYLTPRYALQRLGDWGRDCQPDVWANKALDIAKRLLTNSIRYTPQGGVLYGGTNIPEKVAKGIVIPDCRFRNEFERVKEEGGKVLLVERHCEEFPTKMDDSHISERDILEWGNDVFDHVIENVGDLERLRSDTEKLIALL